MLNTVNFTSGFNTTVTIVFSNCGFPVWLSTIRERDGGVGGGRRL